MLKSHWKYKIEYIGYPKTHKKVSGVYLIDDVYVGASKHNRLRIISHCNNSCNNNHNNLELSDYLKIKIFFNQPIKIYFLDNDIYKEGKYIELLKPIFNKTFNSYSNKKVK
jgi:hypothetical protein